MFSLLTKPKPTLISQESELKSILKAIISKDLQHIGIIMDGNRRWAKNKNLPTVIGHTQGYQNLLKLIDYCALDLKLPALTVYAFSTENWQRSDTEVSHLMKLIELGIKNDLKKIISKNVKIKMLGDKTNLPKQVEQFMQFAESESSHCNGLTLQLAFNYGGQQELTQAIQQIAQNVKVGKIEPQGITAEMVREHLYSSTDTPEPDLIIRTGGEQRLSNFLLWQSAYSELAFIPEYWPDFGPELLNQTILNFLNRSRRFGR